MNQLGMIYKVSQEFEKAEDMYTNLVKIRQAYYGKESENQILPLKNLGQIQALNQKSTESIQTFETATKLAEKILDSGKAKDKIALKTSLGEIVGNLYYIFETSKDYHKALEAAKKYSGIQRELHGEKSTQHAQSLFFISKMYFMIPESEKQDIIDTIQKAIDIE